MSWLRQLFWRRRMYRQLSEEIRAHLDEKVDELVAGGMARREAERAARREFGNVMLMEQRGREVWRWPMIEDLLADVRYALRGLRRAPGFTVVAILTLGLGIGANTAIFSFVNAWLIKPLPYPQADRLMVFLSHDKKRGWTSNEVTSTADFLDFQEQNASFAQTAAWQGWSLNLTSDGSPAFVEGGRVSWNYFQTLGARPLLGRTFAPGEDGFGAADVVVLGEGLWRGRYGGNPNIIGRAITIDGESYTVIGVMPGKFQFPLMGLSDLWLPLALTDQQRANRNQSWFSAFGRLKPGTTQVQAAAECAAIFTRLEKEYPETNTNITSLVSPMTYEIEKNEGTQALAICFWIVGLVLLIACANVANLMLARATRRGKEFAVRGSLGATRRRLARQLLTESLVLFLLGGAAGTLFGTWGISWIESLIPGHIRGYLVNYGQVKLDFTTFGFTLGIALLCGLVLGLIPSSANSKIDLNRTLREASAQASGGGGGARLRRIFVGAEIALAVVVLISTTLLVRSFVNSVLSSPGFDPTNVLVAQLDLPKTKYASDTLTRTFSEEALARIEALPGVISAGAVSAVPFGGFGKTVDIAAVGKPAPRPGEVLGARFTAASPNYFSAMRIGLVKGREFTAADTPGSAPVAVINRTLAKQFWPNEDPIGLKLRFDTGRQAATIVGVVGDVKMYNLRARPERQMYVPLEQFPSQTMGFVVRTADDHGAMANAIRDAIWRVDADQPVSSVEQLGTLMAIVDAGNRILTKLVVFFGVLAMFLGAIGIYGVMSQQVSQRTHEIAIRVALGASSRDLMGMVVGQGLRLALAGVAVGMGAALGATRMLASLLYDVKPSDAASFIGAGIFFAMVAIVACCLPARRAMRVNPVTALRSE